MLHAFLWKKWSRYRNQDRSFPWPLVQMYYWIILWLFKVCKLILMYPDLCNSLATSSGASSLTTQRTTSFTKTITKVWSLKQYLFCFSPLRSVLWLRVYSMISCLGWVKDLKPTYWLYLTNPKVVTRALTGTTDASTSTTIQSLDDQVEFLTLTPSTPSEQTNKQGFGYFVCGK